MKRAVAFYYCVWKFSPTYQLWKSARRELKNLGGTFMDNFPGASSASASSSGAEGARAGGSNGGGGASSFSSGSAKGKNGAPPLGCPLGGASSALLASGSGAAGFVFRGPRMRSTKRQNYKL